MEQEWTPLFALILGVGSQVMMLVSPTVGPRTMLCGAVMLLLLTACLMRESAVSVHLLGAGSIAWHWGQKGGRRLCGRGRAAVAVVPVFSRAGRMRGAVLRAFVVLRGRRSGSA